MGYQPKKGVNIMAKKKPLSTPKIDPERETRTILEGMSNDIKTIAEGHSTIIKKLEKHDEHFGMLETAITEVDASVKRIDARLEKVEQKLDTSISQNEERFKRIESKIEII